MRILSTQEVADLLHVCRKTVTTWCDRGMLPFYWAGTHRKVPGRSLVEFCKKHGVPCGAVKRAVEEEVAQ